MNSDSKQIQICASSRGITDYFFCFVCDEYVWDCDHLIDERIAVARVPAVDVSKLEFLAYDGRSRVLEIEFRVTAPYTPGETPVPPPPRVIQYFNVSRYVLTGITRCKTARRQERYWEDNIRRGFECQTVRTVCRLPRLRRFTEATNLRRYTFDDYLSRMADGERQTFRLVIGAMKVLLLRTLAPKRVAALGGLIECP